MSKTFNLKDKVVYQQWQEESFQADVDVRYLTPIQRWMYRTLCQAAFWCESRPYLPADDSILWKLAGCEDLKQWRAHSRAVKALFTPTEIAGKQLLGRKRIVDDWTRIMEARADVSQKRSEAGRLGGLAKASKSQQMLANDTIVSKEGSEISEVSEENMSALSRLLFSAAKSMGYTGQETLRKEDQSKLDAMELESGPGAYATRQAFDLWLQDHAGFSGNPVAAFISNSEESLAVVQSISMDDGRVDEVIAAVFSVAHNAPTVRDVRKLLTVYSKDDIIDAFKSYAEPLDDWNLNNSVRTFFKDGAGTGIILARRQKKAADAALAASVATSIETGVEARRVEADARKKRIDEEEKLADQLGDKPF